MPLLLVNYLLPDLHLDALTTRVALLILASVLLCLFIHHLWFFWAGHCRTPRGPKALSAVATDTALGAQSVLLPACLANASALSLKEHLSWPYW